MKVASGSKPVDFKKVEYSCGKIEKGKRYSWIFNVFVAFDQFGNAVSFGDPDSTISARVGFFSYYKDYRPKYLQAYWRFLERIINWAFWPIDGKNHCRQAFCSDPYEGYRLGNKFAWVILSIIVLLFCIVIGIILYIVYVFFPGIKREHNCSLCQGEEGSFGFENPNKN